LIRPGEVWRILAKRFVVRADLQARRIRTRLKTSPGRINKQRPNRRGPECG
jgi:hypothetical protein